VHDHQQGGAGDEDELQGPEADVGNWEEVVKADIGASGLACVAVKVFVIIAPHPLGCHHIDQHPEDEDQGEPDAPEGCGVLVHPAQEPFKYRPVHGPRFLLSALGGGEIKTNQLIFIKLTTLQVIAGARPQDCKLLGSSSKHCTLSELGLQPRSRGGYWLLGALGEGPLQGPL
uniref:Uncharacterized protein n=1 Tax=Pelusios castaneus TaxID=367368 RepID=A0A8C8RAI0_9SAUR